MVKKSKSLCERLGDAAATEEAEAKSYGDMRKQMVREGRQAASLVVKGMIKDNRKHAERLRKMMTFFRCSR